MSIKKAVITATIVATAMGSSALATYAATVWNAGTVTNTTITNKAISLTSGTCYNVAPGDFCQTSINIDNMRYNTPAIKCREINNVNTNNMAKATIWGTPRTATVTNYNVACQNGSSTTQNLVVEAYVVAK